jgi:hypothetical protein
MESSFSQILERKWEYNEIVHQLFIDFKKTCDSVGNFSKLQKHITNKNFFLGRPNLFAVCNNTFSKWWERWPFCYLSLKMVPWSCVFIEPYDRLSLKNPKVF